MDRRSVTCNTLTPVSQIIISSDYFFQSFCNIWVSVTPSDNSFTISPHNSALLHSTLLHSYPVHLTLINIYHRSHCCRSRCCPFLPSCKQLHASFNIQTTCTWHLYLTLTYLNPKRAGGGGESAPPPSTFRAIISQKFFSAPRAFMTFFFEVLRNFWRYFRKNQAYHSKVTQHYVIERRLKIWTFSGFVYKTYGKWLLVPKLHFEL